MMSAAVRVCRASSVAAVTACHCRRRTLSALATMHPDPSTCAGSIAAAAVPARREATSRPYCARRAYSNTTLPDPDDILYLPMPKLSPSMTRATVTKWLKAEGDEVNEYDAVLELSTDSLYAPGDAPVEGAPVDMVVELAESGFVGKLFVAEGDTVEVGQAVMAMCEEEENVEALRKAASPGVDFYGDGGDAELRIATYQGYLNGKTPPAE